MTANERPLGSDLAFIDAYENTAADYAEIPELTEEEIARGWLEIGGVPATAADAQKAAVAMAGFNEPVDLPGDVLAAFRAAGPDWRERIVAALRAAAGL